MRAGAGLRPLDMADINRYALYRREYPESTLRRPNVARRLVTLPLLALKSLLWRARPMRDIAPSAGGA
ncbi:MAG: hypothetical protein AAB215_06010 [Planctomycetota bacterium]